LMARDILKALHANAQQGRSGLYRWLSLNFEKLKPGMAGPRPPWVALAKTAAELGITNGGKQYTRQAVRQAWLRVETDKTARGAAATPARRPPSVPLGPDPSPASHAAGAPPAPVVAAPAPPADPAADPAADPPPPRRRIELKPVTMRNSIPPQE
jgi:hypothetical protein